jgi:hypothetical protein
LACAKGAWFEALDEPSPALAALADRPLPCLLVVCCGELHVCGLPAHIEKPVTISQMGAVFDIGGLNDQQVDKIAYLIG